MTPDPVVLPLLQEGRRIEQEREAARDAAAKAEADKAAKEHAELAFEVGKTLLAAGIGFTPEMVDHLIIPDGLRYGIEHTRKNYVFLDLPGCCRVFVYLTRRHGTGELCVGTGNNNRSFPFTAPATAGGGTAAFGTLAEAVLAAWNTRREIEANSVSNPAG